MSNKGAEISVYRVDQVSKGELTLPLAHAVSQSSWLKCRFSFKYEDSLFLRNVGLCLQEYMVSQLVSLQPEKFPM
jgi:hypothetical protein